MGETQEERILQFLEENDTPVVGLREGAMVRAENGSHILKGSSGARIFRRGHDPVEVKPGAQLDHLFSGDGDGGRLMKREGTLLLTRHDVAALLGIEECIAAVEGAFKLHAEGKTLPPGILGLHARDGGFHIKAGLLELTRSYFAAKVNANFPQNSQRFGLPLIQGVIVLCDGENGRPLSVMDSMEITIIRTGAATGVAAKYLARTDSTVATICGCGNQGRISLRAIAKVRDLESAYAFDTDREQAERFAQEMSDELRDRGPRRQRSRRCGQAE